MSRKINVRIENKKIILNENAMQNDYIEMDDLNLISSIVSQEIAAKEKIIQQAAIKSFINDPEQDYQKIKNELYQIKSQYQIKLNEIQYQNQLQLHQITKKLEIDNNKLNLENRNLILKIEQIKNEFNNKYRNEIENIQQKHYYEKENLKLILEKENNQKIAELKNKYEELKRQRNLNIKLLGEELEQWCLNEYNSQFGVNVEDCVFEKITKDINGSKADFRFKVYANNISDINDEDNLLISTTILEMKTQDLNSNEKNKKSNDFHLKKLEEDRIKERAEYAILVSELEPEKEFLILKNAYYPNIIITRPAYFLAVLTIIRNLSLTKQKLILNQIENNLAFKSKQEILEQFENFKNSIIDNALKNLNNNLQDINNAANKISLEAEKIKDRINKAMNTHLKTIENKIKDFKIEKILKKIDDKK